MFFVEIVRKILMPIVLIIEFMKWSTVRLARITRHHLWVDELDWAEAIVYGSMWAFWLFFVGGIVTPLPFFVISLIAFSRNLESIFGFFMSALWILSMMGGTIIMEIAGWENYWDWGYAKKEDEDER